MEWMLDIQLVRRNLSPIQRIAVAEKYRPIYERQARENMSFGGKSYSPKEGLQNSSTLPKENKIDVRAKLAKREVTSINTSEKLSDIAGVGKEIYRYLQEIIKHEYVKCGLVVGMASTYYIDDLEKNIL